jgi:spectinomycin phosphotransferase
MLEKPDLQDQIIITALRESYGLDITGIEFLPLGYDATAWVHRAHTADGQRYFLKVKSGAVTESSVTAPRYLKDQGIEQVVAPLLTRTRALWTVADRFTLILYPFVEGRTGMEIGMSDSQWTELGAVLKAIHSTNFRVEQETFSPKWSGTVRALQAKIKQGVTTQAR